VGAIAVIGAQWGDEGKGKIVDLLAAKTNMVVRYSGGTNAGHTVINAYGEFSLHMIPSGIFSEGVVCIMGNGVVVDPTVFMREMESLDFLDITPDRILISDRAHILMPYHVLLDRLEEKRRGKNAIGTTGQGVGPAYIDKTARRGIRVGDLLETESLKGKLEAALDYANLLFKGVYNHPTMPLNDVYDTLCRQAERLVPHIRQTEIVIHEALDNKKTVLFEGAQGTLLDLDFGTYPYVTSSHPTSGGVYEGAGINPQRLEKIVGVFKAYCTRVGAGPFPTRMPLETETYIRELAKEYGATTGRPRSVGWFDGPIARLSNMVNGYTSAVITRLDVLDTLPSIKVCTHYKLHGETLLYPPSDEALLGECEPVYEELPGWGKPTSQVRRFQHLPYEAQRYVRRLEEIIGSPVDLISIGPRREENIVIRDFT